MKNRALGDLLVGLLFGMFVSMKFSYWVAKKIVKYL